MLWTKKANFDSFETNTKTLFVFHGLAFHSKHSSKSANLQTTWAYKEC